MDEHTDLFLFRYKHVGILRWQYIETLPVEECGLDQPRIEAAPPNVPYTVTVRTTVADDIRPLLCAWELYKSDSQTIPFDQLGTFDQAWRMLRIQYGADDSAMRGRVAYWNKDQITMNTAALTPRKRGRPRKAQPAEAQNQSA